VTNRNIPDTGDNAKAAAEEAIFAVRPEAGRALISGGSAMKWTTIDRASQGWEPARRAPEERTAMRHRDML
jgi:hypothetical protein